MKLQRTDLKRVIFTFTICLVLCSGSYTAVEGWNIKSLQKEIDVRGYQWKADKTSLSGLSLEERKSMLGLSTSMAEVEIAYDDGSQEQTWTGGIAGYVMSVCFTPNFYPCTLKKAKFYMSSVGYNFKLHIYQQANINSPPEIDLIPSFNVEPLVTGWHTVDLSPYNIIIPSGSFAIGIEFTNPNGPSIGSDLNSPISNRSWDYVFLDEEWILFPENYMIRAIIEHPSITTTTSIETTSSSSIRSSTTTEPTTTTTSILADCMLYISISPPEGGTTSPPPPQYFVMGCLPVTVEALPNLGYKFSHWEGDAQRSDNSITLEISGNSSITAVFIIDPCPIKKLYGEHSEETELLKYFRDNVLSKTPEGQELIKLYYRWCPMIVKAMEGDEEFKEEVREMIEAILPLIEKEMRW